MLFKIVSYLCLFFSLAGCGRKTLPVPPQDVIPTPINDLSLHQDKNQIVLTWTLPTKTSTGSRLQDIQSFLVMRAVVAEADFCFGCPQKFSSTMELPVAEAVVEGKESRASYTETLLRPGYRYLYQVKTKAGWRLISDESNRVSFLWNSPAEPPENLTATAGDMRVDLQWSPISRTIDGEQVTEKILYQVYRGKSVDRLQAVGETVDTNSYADKGLLNDTMYFYKISGVWSSSDSKVIGMASRLVSATPKDKTPPLPPRNLMAVKTGSGIKIIWDRGTEADLAGYKIYRRLPLEKTGSSIGQVMGAELSFSDNLSSASGEEGWYYSVSAFDQADPANESVLSKELFYESF